MEQLLIYIRHVVVDSVKSFLQNKEGREINEFPASGKLADIFPDRTLEKEELLVFLLSLLPHVCPEALDPFFIFNKELDRPFTQFGGWRGRMHQGFLPTGETVAFLIARTDQGKRKKVMQVLAKDHWFYKERVLWLEGQGEGEPFLSGRLYLSDEILARFYGTGYEPDYSTSFPAKRITTPLYWEDLVLPWDLMEELEDINLWLANQYQIRSQWELDRILKPGFRCLFYGPPGTGKTLTAQLLGKQNGLPVYRVDLSMIVSKYIGETEKNLAAVFDKAAHHNWILFFDEADALFSQRTSTQSVNDRHANQEVAYLLQRIEDFPGIVVLATNLKENIDEAFLRRFQAVLYFPMPDESLRFQLWKKMIPQQWNVQDEVLYEAAQQELSGGSMINVIRSCALVLYRQKELCLSAGVLQHAIRQEQAKEGKLVGK